MNLLYAPRTSHAGYVQSYPGMVLAGAGRQAGYAVAGRYPHGTDCTA